MNSEPRTKTTVTLNCGSKSYTMRQNRNGRYRSRRPHKCNPVCYQNIEISPKHPSVHLTCMYKHRFLDIFYICQHIKTLPSILCASAHGTRQSLPSILCASAHGSLFPSSFGRERKASCFLLNGCNVKPQLVQHDPNDAE